MNLEKFLLELYPGYANKSVEYLNKFVDDLLTSLETELQAIKSDSGSAGSARVFAALSRHITAAQTSEPLAKRYITVASAIFKLAANNFPLSATFGSAALALSDLKVRQFLVEMLFLVLSKGGKWMLKMVAIFSFIKKLQQNADTKKLLILLLVLHKVVAKPRIVRIF